MVEFKLGTAAKIFAEDFFFDFELMLVTGVLVVASTAGHEIWAGRIDPFWGWFDHCIQLRAGEAWFLLGECGFYFFFWEDEGNEDGFAAAVVVCWQAGEAVAAVD